MEPEVANTWRMQLLHLWLRLQKKFF